MLYASTKLDNLFVFDYWLPGGYGDASMSTSKQDREGREG
jgi:hypothetical protein